MTVGEPTTRLVILRGNSASGKSSVAEGIRRRFGRGVALVQQDVLRRQVLREPDIPGCHAIGLIDTVARYSLDHGFHVVVEGILNSDRYGAMLEALRRDHCGLTRMYYLDVPFEETLVRHAGKPESAEFGASEMRAWYRELDLLPGAVETVVPSTSSLQATVDLVLRDSGLAGNGD
ncbi:kinase [Streptacidiphilus pinicola]|uniref:Kinase n=1 Tax=Streptacidiphilus pinicola TaxID=2219663 RepID=A0A2X0KFV2_9ACTN|nr:AAA family ATPase [Streptacidiphilus pinicola]RAG85720.1 kinase [Streptacidiphilus pinicola]